MCGRVRVLRLVVLAMPAVCLGTTLTQVSKEHAVYVQAQEGDVLSITIDHTWGTDPDYIYIYAPNGKLQVRLEVAVSATVQVTLNSGAGIYKLLPVNHGYVHDYSIPGAAPMVVEPFAHQDLIYVNGSANLYFQVPPGTPSMTFHAHSMWSLGTVTEELYDPSGSLVHTFVMPPNTFQAGHVVANPTAGSWRCRFVTSSYVSCGAWLEGVPNFFSSTPSGWFEPAFHDVVATASLTADANVVVSTGSRIGVNWWLNPWYPKLYVPERDAVIEAVMDTARLSAIWRFLEPANDNSDPFDINWQAFDFQAADALLARYYDDIVSVIPDAMPVLLLFWNNVGANAVTWQLENPAIWTQTQRDEYAEFVLATMIHLVAPDLQNPPDPGPAYSIRHVELLNEPNISMGGGNYQAYFDVVTTVGRRLRAHPDSRINTLKIVASGIGSAWGRSDQELENWIGKLIDQADAYVDGVNWHQYDHRRIEECHRFAENIEKVKGWLATRGDGIADEEIIMTEANQHGGPPSCWRRQDTFYQSRWWAGVCLATLRSGIDLLHYYKLVDETLSNFYASMLFNDGPYDPPIFPGGPPHSRKPVYEAAKFINVNRRDQVVSSACGHPEIAHAVTISEDHTGVTVLLANLFDRVIDLNVEVILPPDMQNQSYCAQVYWLDKVGSGSIGANEGERELGSLPAQTSLNTLIGLDAQTIYAVVFQRVGDFDGDGDVDLADFIDFETCLLGPGSGLGTGCACFDFDGDGDNDLKDFAAFQASFTG